MSQRFEQLFELEHLLLRGRVHTRAMVDHRQANVLGLQPQEHRDLRVAAAGVTGIDDQIHDHLLELRRVGVDERGRRQAFDLQLGLCLA
jgi:hypothetical protein